MNDMPEINQRIFQLIEHFSKGNVADFTRLTKISSHQVLSRIFKIDKRTNKYPKPSAKILEAIEKNLSDVNIGWVISGNGSMLLNDSSKTQNYLQELSNFTPKQILHYITENLESFKSEPGFYLLMRAEAKTIQRDEIQQMIEQTLKSYKNSK